MQNWHQQNQPSLLSLAHKHTTAQFPDAQTHGLYQIFAGANGERYDEAEMHEAEAKTLLNSHFSISKCKNFQKAREMSFAIEGMTLRENLNSKDFNRNRTYSIVKVSKERKRSITMSDFQKAPKASGAPREIVYSYAEKEHSQTQQMEVVQSRYQPVEKQHSLKSSRNDLRSLLSTRYNPNTNYSQHKQLLTLPPAQRAKPYKFTKLKEKCSVQQEKLTCNLFSFLDPAINKQEPTLKKYPSAKMEIVAKPIKLKPWK